jgi:hypothetical protein
VEETFINGKFPQVWITIVHLDNAIIGHLQVMFLYIGAISYDTLQTKYEPCFLPNF